MDSFTMMYENINGLYYLKNEVSAIIINELTRANYLAHVQIVLQMPDVILKHKDSSI